MNSAPLHGGSHWVRHSPAALSRLEGAQFHKQQTLGRGSPVAAHGVSSPADSLHGQSFKDSKWLLLFIFKY